MTNRIEWSDKAPGVVGLYYVELDPRLVAPTAMGLPTLLYLEPDGRARLYTDGGFSDPYPLPDLIAQGVRRFAILPRPVEPGTPEAA